MHKSVALALSGMTFAALTLSASVMAHTVKIGDLVVEKSNVPATVAGQANGAAYFSIKNNGKTEDELISASSPVAGNVEIHTAEVIDGVMKMRIATSVAIKPGTTLVMTPGAGHHVMLKALKEPLVAGTHIPVNLTFKHAGTVLVESHVNAVGVMSQ